MTEQDLRQINNIVNWHTENGHATLIDKTSDSERSEWFQKFKHSPKEIALVAVEENDLISGFICSFFYRGGGVFQNTLEISIYLRHDQQGKGVASILYQQLLEELKGKGIHRLVVGIALPNDRSIVLHKKFGFEEIGVFDEYAFYKGAYRSSLWLQKKMDN